MTSRTMPPRTPKNKPSPGPAAKRRPSSEPQPWLKRYPEGVDWNSPFTGQPVSELLDETVRRHGAMGCTNFQGKTLTYAEIAELVDRTACGLQRLGVGRGTRIGLLLPNTPTFVVFYFAILKTGATVVNFNPLYTVEELEHQIADSGTTIMVTLDLKLLFDKVGSLLERGVLKKAVVCDFARLLPGVKALLFRLLKAGQIASPGRSAAASAVISESELLDNDGDVKPVRIAPDKDIAVLQYTGGTTGTPKGAMLTHANLTINVKQVCAWADRLLSNGERIMGILPFFHVFAMTSILNLGVATGSLLILMPRFDLLAALKLIHRAKPTVLPGVPTMYNAMMHDPRLAKYDLSSLKLCISGGAALPVEVKRGFESLSGCTLVEGYGLSETSPVATCNPVDGRVVEGSIGLPLPQTRLSIRAIDTPEKVLPIGENGEICIAGPQVMTGYWNKPEDTRDVFVGEFFRTGDVGHMDEEGFTYIVDRLKDMINCSGYKVYPRRIEEAIYQFPAVEEVTVVGIPDDYRGEAPKAYVKLRKNHAATADDILRFLEPKISKLEMPAEIEFRDQLPKTMIGKLSRKELRAERDARTKKG